MITEHASKILVIRLSSFGDILLTTPIFRAIKQNNPNCQIDFLCKESFAPILKFNPNISSHYNLNPENDISDVISLLQTEEYNLVVDLQNNIRSKQICSKLNKPVIKYGKPNLKKFLLVNFKWNLYKRIDSVVELYAKNISNISLDNEGLEFYNKYGQVVKEITHKKVVGICPGSRHFTKMWPKEHFIELCDLLSGYDYEIKLLGGKSDKQICDDIKKASPKVVNECSDDDIFATAESMKECKIVVCNDSGLMHFASALKVPLIAFFGSTVREFGFYPYNCENFIFSVENLKCRPCTHIGKSKCPKDHFKCMLDIKPLIVFEKIKQMLSNE
jgi:lipopolysaccharide heptosyltransferase II